MHIVFSVKKPLMRVMCASLLLGYAASPACAAKNNELYEGIYKRLQEQADMRKKEKEEAAKKAANPEPDAGNDIESRYKDPRNTSPSEAYGLKGPAEKGALDKADAKKVCTLEPASTCLADMKEAEAACQSAATDCGNNINAGEDASCKVYSCEFEKALCMQQTYSRYMQCLDRAKTEVLKPTP